MPLVQPPAGILRADEGELLIEGLFIITSDHDFGRGSFFFVVGETGETGEIGETGVTGVTEVTEVTEEIGVTGEIGD